VLGAAESHRARPRGAADLRLRLDPDALDRAAASGGRDDEELEAALGAIDDRGRKRVLREPDRARLRVEQIEAEARPLRVGKRFAVCAHLRLIEAAAGEWLHRRELHPAMKGMRDPEREPPSTGRQRPGDDPVADIERLVRPAAVERRCVQRGIAEPVPASIHRTVASSKRRLIAWSGWTATSIGACTFTGVLPMRTVTRACEPSGSITITRAGMPSPAIVMCSARTPNTISRPCRSARDRDIGTANPSPANELSRTAPRRKFIGGEPMKPPTN